MPDLLVAESIGKAYGDFWAVRHFAASFAQGRLTSIIGPNGAGKTTLVNMLTGMARPDHGRVVLDGQDVTGLAIHERVRRGISRSFQITSVFADLTVLDNVLVPVFARRNQAHRLFRRRETDTDSRAEAFDLLEQVGLAHAARQRVRVLPHGDKRMLEIAMAIAPRPRLCFLDEPTTGMNPSERAQVLGLIGRLHESGRTTFVVIEHDMDVVFSVSEWILVMHRGGLLSEGPPASVREDERVREVYLGEEVDG
jgi:branched-chain amino acid transport system ATP-binding protein